MTAGPPVAKQRRLGPLEGLFSGLLTLVDTLAGFFFAAASILAGAVKTSEKVRLFFAERSKSSWQFTRTRAIRLAAERRPTFWFHVASAGELEQAIPLARALTVNGPCTFIVSYMSPSARPFLANFPGQDRVLDLALHPFSRTRIREIFVLLAPDAVVFVRYDLWPSLVDESYRAGIPLMLLAGTRRLVTRGLLAAPAALLKILLLRRFDQVFAVGQEDASFFARTLGSHRVTRAGDPKWARARERAARRAQPGEPVDLLSRDVQRARRVTGSRLVAAFGSPHAEEWAIACQLLLAASTSKIPIVVILAPHDVGTFEINRLRGMLAAQGLVGDDTVVRLLSEVVAGKTWGFEDDAKARADQDSGVRPSDRVADEVAGDGLLPDRPSLHSPRLASSAAWMDPRETPPRALVYIADLMGHLAEIYGMADVAVVGGGFDGQLHNCLEPSARGVPVLFGPNHARAPEATTLLEAGAAKSFESTEAMFQFLLQCVSVPRPVSRSSQGQGGADAALARMALSASQLFDSLPQTTDILRAALEARVKMLSEG